MPEARDRSSEQLEAAMRRCEEAYRDYGTRWDALMARLRTAPQLVIAT
jgi:hypothetical protein